jgi:hypothetical protein
VYTAVNLRIPYNLENSYVPERLVDSQRTRHLPGGEGWPVRKADNLTAICEPTVWKMWEPRRLTTLWASTACYRDSFASPPPPSCRPRSDHLGIPVAAKKPSSLMFGNSFLLIFVILKSVTIRM